MKRNRIVVVIVVIAVIVVGMVLYRVGSQYTGVEVVDVPVKDAGVVTQSQGVKQAPVAQATPQHKPSEGYSKVALTDSDHQLMAELDVPEAAVRKLFKAIDSITGPIEFYGRVMDQHGKPVVGAKVVYSVDSAPGFGGPGRYTATTDDEGRFSISGVRGISMIILDAKKPGYDSSLPGGGYFRLRSKNPAELVSTYTQNNPYIVHAWKLPKAEAVWSARRSKVKLIPDGRPYSVTFADRRASIEEGHSDKAHLWISMTAEPDEKLYRRGNWSIVIEAVDGGVQPTEDELMYEAPEAGYSRRWERSYSMGEADYESVIRRQEFYFIAHNKGVYGRLIMDIYPFTYRSRAQLDKGIANDSSIYLNYTVNPHGSRNLYGGKLHDSH